MEFLFLAMLLLLIVGGYYSFSVAPRQRAFKKQYKLVSVIEVGDEVVTMGGVIGRVKRIDSKQGVMILEVAKGIELRVVSMAINQKYDAEALAEGVEKATE